MITVIKQGAAPEQVEELIAWLRSRGLEVHVSQGNSRTILGLVGDVSGIDTELLAGLDVVESVKRITEPFLLCSRQAHPADSIVQVGNVRIGGGHFCLIAGPCSVENSDQIIQVATQVKAAGADLLRGGAFKPRTSPYDFQGLGAEGLRMLLEAKKVTGLPIVTEIMSASHLDLFAEVDVIQVGARNMQNYDLLKELGRAGKPVLLKRGPASTLHELLMCAEYIMSEGNSQVILCERGIRTFDTHSRNTLDLAAVPALHELSHLPVIVDPSHATGKARLVPPMALAAAACGADGVMVEVHNDPMCALCDGAQSLLPAQFAALAQKLRAVRAAVQE
ncbi:MAG: 3-deoxy-7-phosphoheptulonate synthase [Oscillospiraceae bacterium]|nr:3-deoxy-7-phosphoheptulonate synthase [Oscillospiraceae bacterium]